jgi:hypothetical protein
MFAVLLLEGAVVTSLASLAPHLQLPPRTLLGPLRLAKQTDFLAALGGACSRSALPSGPALAEAAVRLYIPAVRSLAATLWGQLASKNVK